MHGDVTLPLRYTSAKSARRAAWLPALWLLLVGLLLAANDTGRLSGAVLFLAGLSEIEANKLIYPRFYRYLSKFTE